MQCSAFPAAQKREELVTNAVREGSLGSSNHDMTESGVWMKAGEGSSRLGEQNLAYAGNC